VLTKTLKTGNPIAHSPAIVPSRWSERLNHSDADVIHLHWINGEMVSIADLGKFTKPVVWTLHDMWAFCGAEHVATDKRWRDGYKASNRPTHENRFDLNCWTWERKVKHWKHPMHIVTPSRWLANCVGQSTLMREWPVTVIPNAIDTDLWQPIDKALARELLHLPRDVPLLLFGAWGGSNEHHKGFDLLQAALIHLQGQLPGLELVVFGQLPPKEPVVMGFPINYVGHMHDDISLRLLYNAADVMVIPSRVDNLPNTGLEAHACGTPVVAFDTCGLPDIVKHRETGYLAKAFDSEDFAAGLHWTLQNQMINNGLGEAARARAVNMWSYGVVGPLYIKAYEAAIAHTRSNHEK
jgi:glycosyltransferase involved in cell wall biosynthesis